MIAAYDILPATADDEQAIVPLMVAFNDGEGIQWKPDTMVPALRRFLREPALGSMLLARDRVAGTIAGYGMATFGYDLEYAGRDAFVTELFVEPTYRGQGMGKNLLDALVGVLRDQGVKAVHLMVRPENERARALYEGRNFRLVPRLVMTRSLDEG